MPPDGLAEPAQRRIWGLWDYKDPKTKLIKTFIVVAGERGPTTLKLAQWALSHQFETNNAGLQRRRAGIAAQLGPDEIARHLCRRGLTCLRRPDPYRYQ
jgi:hypothetical protein